MSLGQLRSIHRYPVKSMAGESLTGVEVGLEGLLGDRAFAVRDEAAGELRSARKWPGLLQLSARYLSEPTATFSPPATITLPDGSETQSDQRDVSQRLSACLGLSATLHPRRPASDKQHYRRANTGASAAGLLVRSASLRKVVDRLAKVGANGADMRAEFGRERDEPLPDLSQFPPEIYEFVSPPGSYFDAYPIHLITTASLATLRSKHPSGDWELRRFRPNLLIDTGELTGLPELGWAGRTLRIGALTLECTVATPRCNMVMQAQGALRKDPLILRTIVRDADQNLGVYARVKRAGRVAVGDRVELV